MKYLIFRVYDILLSKPLTGEVLTLLDNRFTAWKKSLQYVCFMFFKIRPSLNEITIKQHLKELSSLYKDGKIINAKALVHVTFHFDKGRIAYLNEAVRQVGRLNFSDKEIVVDTNIKETKSLLEILKLPCKISIAKNLSHPFHLTWAHRESMKNRFDDFDVFVYMEDDIFIPGTTIARWYNEKEKLKKHGFLPGFLRVERNRQGRLVSSDFEHPVSKDNIVKIEGVFYLATPFPYQACWIYDKETMREFLQSNAYEHGWEEYANLNYIRENAAIGLAYESPPNGYSSRHLLALNNEGIVSSETFVFHVPSNYGKKIRPHPSMLGTVPVESLVSTEA